MEQFLCLCFVLAIDLGQTVSPGLQATNQNHLRGSETELHIHLGSERKLHRHRGLRRDDIDDNYVFEPWRTTGSGFLEHQVVKLEECICPTGTVFHAKEQHCDKQLGIGGDCGVKDPFGLRLQVCEDGLRCSDWGFESCPENYYVQPVGQRKENRSGDICCNFDEVYTPCGQDSFDGTGFEKSWVCPRGCSYTKAFPWCTEDPINLEDIGGAPKAPKACEWRSVPASCIGCSAEESCPTGEERRVQGNLPFEQACAKWYIISEEASSCTNLKAFPAEEFYGDYDDYDEYEDYGAAFGNATTNATANATSSARNTTVFVHVRDQVRGMKHTWGCADSDTGVLGKDGLNGLPEWARDGEYGGYCANVFNEIPCSDAQDDDDFTASKMCCACGGGQSPVMGPDEVEECMEVTEGAQMFKMDTEPWRRGAKELAEAARAKCKKEDGCKVEERCAADKPIFAPAIGGAEAQEWWCNPSRHLRLDEFQYYQLADKMLPKVTDRASAKLKAKLAAK